MFKLIGLEWSKNRLSSYFITILICIVGIFGTSVLMGWGAKAEGELMFSNYADYMALTNILIHIVFMIFSAVILSRLVIEEYRSNTIQLLFTYPLQRKKIMFSKLSIVFGFCFFSIILATAVISILAYFLNPMIEFFNQPMQVSDIISTIPSVLLSAFMISGISLIPLFFGMRKKSTATTITSSVLVGFVINSTIPDGAGQTSLFQFIGVPIVFCVIGLLIGYATFSNVNKKDLV